MVEKFKLTVHAFDPTPESIEWVKQQNFPANFVMHEYGIADFDGNAYFYPPESPEHISHTLLDRTQTKNSAIRVPVKRLSTIMELLGHNQIDVLKMHVEGAEYNIVEDIEKSNIRPKQILIECHHRFSNLTVRQLKRAYYKLKKMGYRLFLVTHKGEDSGFILKS